MESVSTPTNNFERTCNPNILVSSTGQPPLVVGGTGADKNNLNEGHHVRIRASATLEGKFHSSAWNHGILGGPNAPQVAVSVGNGRIALAWPGNTKSIKSGAAINGYQVSHSDLGKLGTSWDPANTSAGMNGDWTQTGLLGAGTRFHTLTDLDRTKSYNIMLRARNNAGDNDAATNWWGFGAHVIIKANVVSGKPKAVAKPTVRSTQTQTFNVSWNPPADHGGAEVHYYTIRYTSSTANATVGEQTVPATFADSTTGNFSTPVGGITSGAVYNVQIIAHNVNGAGEASEAVTVTAQ